MEIPIKVRAQILEEANKYARFSWYNGWEKSSGYISSSLTGDSRYGSCRIYIKWEKKKAPTDEQVKVEVEKYIDSLLRNEQHHSTQRDFTHYFLSTFYCDLKRHEKEVMMSVTDALPRVIAALEKSEDFDLPVIQGLHNDLKNYECDLNNYKAIEHFLEHGRKRIGE